MSVAPFTETGKHAKGGCLKTDQDINETFPLNYCDNPILCPVIR